jgi:hypothetical protein
VKKPCVHVGTHWEAQRQLAFVAQAVGFARELQPSPHWAVLLFHAQPEAAWQADSLVAVVMQELPQLAVALL